MTRLLDDMMDACAIRLEEAWANRRTIPPISRAEQGLSADDAYEIQSRWSAARERRGEKVLGHKIGLTSEAMREQIGVSEPDYGRLWESRYFAASGGWAEMPYEIFLQPRAEGELAFHLSRPLEGEDVTADDALAATDAIGIAIEVIDSRIADWQIALVDTIADNASYGAFTLGPWDVELPRADLAAVGMRITKNGRRMVEARGSDVLGHPAEAVAWLARRLSRLRSSIQPGDIVLSGSLGPSLSAVQGDEFVVETDGQAPLGVRFS